VLPALHANNTSNNSTINDYTTAPNADIASAWSEHDGLSIASTKPHHCLTSLNIAAQPQPPASVTTTLPKLLEQHHVVLQDRHNAAGSVCRDFGTIAAFPTPSAVFLLRAGELTSPTDRLFGPAFWTCYLDRLFGPALRVYRRPSCAFW
jgi:hypothetical protein